jgi:outer membrane protein assembly factor BamB
VAWSDNLGAAAGRTSLVDLSAITGMPVIDSQVVYAISLGGLLVANDLRSGRRLWEREAAGAQTPWVAGDWLFLVTTDQQVAAVAKQDGTVAWLTQLPRYDNPEKQEDPIEWAGPVLVANRLVLGGGNQKAVAVSPYTGKVLGSEDLPDASLIAPVVASGTLLMVTNDGSLVALR